LQIGILFSRFLRTILIVFSHDVHILGISIDNYIQYWYIVDYVLFTLFPYLICLVDIQII